MQPRDIMQASAVVLAGLIAKVDRLPDEKEELLCQKATRIARLRPL